MGSLFWLVLTASASLNIAFVIGIYVLSSSLRAREALLIERSFASKRSSSAGPPVESPPVVQLVRKPDLRRATPQLRIGPDTILTQLSGRTRGPRQPDRRRWMRFIPPQDSK